MDSDLKWTIVIAVLFLGFLLGSLELSKALSLYTLQAVTFMGEERTVAVYTNRREVAVGVFPVRNEIFERDGNMITRTTFAVPRRGILAWTRVASNNEVELFHRFFKGATP